MARAPLTGGIELEYETFGSPESPATLLVMGLGAQLIAWPEPFCRQLAEHGRFVIRFDNRDVGLSTKIDDHTVDLGELFEAVIAGTALPEIPYSLSDMATDAIGLLDHLGIDRAHVVGASLGGMIAQTLAIEHPDRLISVTSIMSTVGDPAYGQTSPEATAVLVAPAPRSREEAIEGAGKFAVIGSQRYFDLAEMEATVAAAWDRGLCPEGFVRQLAARFASGDRSALLGSVEVPMLVVHGLDDCLVAPSGGRRTAELVPGAHLLELADMGHDLPEPLWPLLIGAIIGHGDIALTQSGGHTR